MKITPVSSPHAIQQAPSSNQVNPDTKARVVAMLTGQPRQGTTQGQAQEHSVQNANQVSPEEMSAVKPSQEAEITDNSIVSEDTQEVEAPQKSAKDLESERRFADLARQERVLRARAQKQQQELKAKEDAVAAREAAIQAKSDEYTKGYISRDKLKLDPLAVLAEAGLSYDELTQQLLNQQPRDPRVEARMDRLEAENRALRQANEDSQKNYKQQQAESYQQAVKQIKNDAMNLIKSEPETYEAIAKTKSIDDVVELIEKTYAKNGILLSVEEAAQEVENYLVEEGVNTISSIDKIKKRLAQNSASTAQTKPVTQAATKATPQTQPTQMKTLTNATSSTRKLSARERALLAFKGELKS